MRKAISVATSKTRIFVLNGTYNNNNYGGGDNNGPLMTIKDKTDILLTNYPGHFPVLKFDKSGGVVMIHVRSQRTATDCGKYAEMLFFYNL